MTATATGDGAALLAAIEAQPDEDMPRLVFADWLDGQETARMPCKRCRGTKFITGGDDYGTSEYLCPTCAGTGIVIDSTNADRAELVRVQVEIERDFPIPPGGGMRPGECTQCWARRVHAQTTNGPCRCFPELRTLRTRESALLGDGSRWRKGPACAACVWEPGVMTDGNGGSREPCARCFGTGDAGGLTRLMPLENPEDGLSPLDVRQPPKVEFHRGFPRVHCQLTDVCREELVKCVGCNGGNYVADEEAASYDERIGCRPMIPRQKECPRCNGGRAPVTRTVPTPWALAVVRHHRGCELWLDDREPGYGDHYAANMTGGDIGKDWAYWYDTESGRNYVNEDHPHQVPGPIAKLLIGMGGKMFVNGVYFPADLARLALARSAAAWARGHLQKETPT